MSTPRLIGGIVLALLAIFSGGCGLLYFGAGVLTLIDGKHDYGITVIAFAIGVVPGALLGFLAWRVLRRPPTEPS